MILPRFRCIAKGSLIQLLVWVLTLAWWYLIFWMWIPVYFVGSIAIG